MSKQGGRLTKQELKNLFKKTYPLYAYRKDLENSFEYKQFVHDLTRVGLVEPGELKINSYF